MNYFRLLGIIFGLAAMLKPFYMHLLPWDENRFTARAYSEKRPSWIAPVAVAGLLLVGFTWYKELTTDIPYSIILTVIFSLTAVKAIYFLADYSAFQKWVARMLEKNNGRK
jgi:H+/Cl- antiporter ClcA